MPQEVCLGKNLQKLFYLQIFEIAWLNIDYAITCSVSIYTPIKEEE